MDDDAQLAAESKGESSTGPRANLVWGLVDQAICSLTNFGGSVLAARALSVEGFGAFAVGLVIYLVVTGVARAWTSEPLAIRFAAERPAVRHGATAFAAGSSVILGTLVGTSLVLAGLVSLAPTGPVLVALGLSLPALLAQDLWRHALIIDLRSRAAALNDCAWLATMILLFALIGSDDPAPWVALLSWSLGAFVGAVLGALQVAVVPRVRIWNWCRIHSDLAARFTLEFLVVAGVAYAATLCIVIFEGSQGAAALRGSQVLMGPVTVMFLGAQAQLLPYMARRSRQGAVDLGYSVRAVSALLACLTVCWAAALVLLPERWGQLVLGRTWTAASPLVVSWAAVYLANAVGFGPRLALRALGDARRSLRIRLAMLPVALSSALLGAYLAGARGLLAGLALAYGGTAVAWWAAYRRSMRQHDGVLDPRTNVIG